MVLRLPTKRDSVAAILVVSQANRIKLVHLFIMPRQGAYRTRALVWVIFMTAIGVFVLEAFL